MFGKKLAIVDIETTGTSGYRDRIIELAIIRVEKEKIVDKFTTLVNPQTHVSPFIEQFTGISKEDLESAPLFSDITARVRELLDDAIFVAHNVRFDYSFIKAELKRTGIPFKAKTFCTVRLSRKLFPQYSSHGLESLINRFGFSFKNRHRAYDDAYVLWQFFQKIKKEVPADTFSKTWHMLSRSLYSGDKSLKQQVDNLPESPGIYIFYDKKNTVLYVGKSKNISERVISHFYSDIESPKHLEMMKEVKKIGHIQTAGELGALLLESRMVKKLLPVYNRQLQKKKQFLIVNRLKDKNGYFSFKTTTADCLDNLDFENIFGIYNNKRNVKELMDALAEKYFLCKKLLGIEDTKSACFDHKLEKYNARFLIAFLENRQFRPWPFKGSIEITEKNEMEEISDCFTVNKWCLLSRKNNADDEEKYDYRFNIDTYRIFSRYLRKNKNYRVVK